jgi:hypothetical protein
MISFSFGIEEQGYCPCDVHRLSGHMPFMGFG